MAKRIGLQTALTLMCEAHELMDQPHPIDALVTPENPGGQSTATRRDGTKVDRGKFADEAYRTAMAALEREKARRKR